MRYVVFLLICLAILFVPASVLYAKNVDLVTLPERQSVQLTIYNSEDITLVKEIRNITLKKGMNKLQFSWANTLIDPTSVEFRMLEKQDQAELLDTVYPGQKPQHLIWNIESKIDAQVKVEVSYFTSGISWKMDYVGICTNDETKMDFKGYVRVFNNSGEEYENAEVRMIVGNINLVEKIADLARRRGIPVPAPSAPASRDYENMKKESYKGAFDRAEKAKMPERERKEIVKEGLSEYFMFSVPGTETIPNGWSKRMLAVDSPEAKFDIIYRLRTHQYGGRPVRFFTWQNDEEHKLGDSPMPDGLIRLFKDNGNDGLSFLGQQSVNYVPIKGLIEINLGADDLVVYKTKKMSTKRFNFHFYVPDNMNRRQDDERVDGWDEEQQWVDEIRNYRDKPIVFEIHRIWYGDVELTADNETKLFNYQTAETKFTVKPGEKFEYKVKVLTHNGSNQKNNRIILKK